MTEQAENKIAGKTGKWDRPFFEGRGIKVATKSWAMLCVAIPTPVDTKHAPFIAISLSCGDDNICEIYVKDRSEYKESLMNIIDACKYFIENKEYDEHMEEELKRAWEIYNELKALPDDNPIIDLSKYA